MRNLLAFIGLLVVGFGGAGWYLGWYKLSVSRGLDGNLQIQADVDTNKVKKDTSEGLSEGFNKLSTAVEKQADKAAKDANTALPSGTPGTTPGPVNTSPGSTFNPFSPSLPEAPKLPVNTPTIPPRGTTIQLLPPK